MNNIYDQTIYKRKEENEDTNTDKPATDEVNDTENVDEMSSVASDKENE